MNYLSVCSGIEAASVAWKPLGWKPVGFSEIENFPCEVLKHRFPDVTNYGDMTKYREWEINEKIDLLVGGTPCQSFSIAGLRGGLDDGRGNLALTFCHIAATYRPRWIVWENVPGVLSSGGGRDFGTFLGALAELGYGFAYRVLDAQFFGVAQRRKRVFVVGYLGDWRPPAAVLFESESLSGNIKKGEKKRQGVAESLEESAAQHCPLVMSSGQANAEIMHDKCPALTCLHEQPILAIAGDNTNVEIIENKSPALKASQRTMVSDPCLMDRGGSIMHVEYGKTGTLRAKAGRHQPIVMQEGTTGVASYGNQVVIMDEKQPTLRTTCPGIVVSNLIVRYLTPVECERLQGFPDNWTQIAYSGRKKENCPKTPRYKALGNSMAVPVMEWIGERIEMVENHIKLKRS